MFRGLSADDCEVLSGIFHPTVYATGQPIFARGELSNMIGIVAEGEVQVTIQSDRETRTALEIATLTQGQSVGEFVLAKVADRSASVVAKSRVVLLESSREKLLELFAEHPNIGYVAYRNLFTTLVDRIVVGNELLAKHALF